MRAVLKMGLRVCRAGRQLEIWRKRSETFLRLVGRRFLLSLNLIWISSLHQKSFEGGREYKRTVIARNGVSTLILQRTDL
jgi:hypothetical protein